MSDTSVDVALRIRLAGQEAIQGLKTLSQQATAEASKMGTAVQRTGTASTRLVQQASTASSQAMQRTHAAATKAILTTANTHATAMQQAATKGAQAVAAADVRAQSSGQKLWAARETLGLRSEQRIQREIAQTEAAYRRLTASGNLSWREQARVADQMRRRVAELNTEMGKVSATQRAMGAMKGAGLVATGVVAAGMAVSGDVRRAMSFDERLAGMANTAFTDEDTAGRIAGMQVLKDAINKAVGDGGGGTREDAAEALDKLIASGAVERDDAIGMLPQLTRFAAASSSSATELATIGIRAQQTFGIKAAELPNVLNMAIAAGQAGGFELKDMAKWLPEQMAVASQVGFSGREGFAKLAAFNQAAAITAGSEDKAGNNVVSLLRTIVAAETATKAKGMGFDLAPYLMRERSQGVDSLDAFVKFADRMIEKSPQYAALQEQRTQLAQAGTNEERRAVVESMGKILEGSELSKLVGNQEAMMALLAYMGNREYLGDVHQQVKANDVATGGAGDANYAVVAQTAGFRARQADQQVDASKQSILDSMTPIIGAVAQKIGEFASEWPKMTGAIALGTTAVGAFSGALGLASLALRGRGGRVGMPTPVTPVSSGGRMSIGRRLLRGTGVGLATGAVAMAGEYALDKTFGEDSAVSRYGSRALNYGAIGAGIGSVLPFAGTVVGGAVGAGVGLLTEAISDWFKSSEKKEEPRMEARMQVGLAPGLVLQQQSVQASGMDMSIDVGSHWDQN